MRRFTRIGMVLLALWFLPHVNGQNVQGVGKKEILQFYTTSHDFGELKEEDGTASYQFKFKNISDQPVELTSVKASCGCTTPKWTKDPIPPGGEGMVEAVYDMRNRPGPFSKSITVQYRPVNGNEEHTQILYIRGTVTPKPKGVEDLYPITYGSLRFSTNHVAFGTLYDNEIGEKSITIYNPSDKAILIKTIEKPKFLSVKPEQNVTIQPKDSVRLLIQFDAKAANDYGFVHARMELKTNDTQIPDKFVYVSADIREYFPPMSEEELAKAPRIVFSEKNHDFGEITEGDVVTATFKIINEGQKPLIIRKIKASCGCTAGVVGKTELKPGEATELKVTFNSAHKVGSQYKTVTIISNDPQNPVTTVSVKAEVKEKPQK